MRGGPGNNPVHFGDFTETQHRDASDGVRQLNMLCSTGNYHVKYTADKSQVTCSLCLKRLNLTDTQTC